MMNWKVKTLVIILVAAALLLIPDTSYANDWLEGYKYRKLIPITGSLEVGGAVLYEYYNTNDDNDYDVYTSHWAAQSFTTSESHNVTSIKLKLSRFISPGTITVSVTETNENGHPTGDDLCSGTSDGDTLPSFPSFEWRKIAMEESYSVSTETKYAIVVRAPDAMGYLYWATDITSPLYDGGNLETSDDSGSSWDSEAGIDAMFEVWGGGEGGEEAGTYYKMPLLTIYANVSEGEEDGVIELNDLCASFPDDIRFTGADGSTELNHGIVGSDADLAKFIVQPQDNVSINQSVYTYFGKPGAGSGCSEFRENYTSYSETDPNGHIVLDGDYHIDFQAEADEDAYRYDDKGGSTDFEHYLQVNLTFTDVNYAAGIPWMLANDIDDEKGLETASKDHIYLWVGRRPGPAYRFSLRECVGGATDSDNYNSVALNTSYYLVFNKTGTDLSCEIYSDVILETSADTLSVTLDNASYDFQYMYAAVTRNVGASRTAVLDIDNLFMRTTVTPEPAWGTPGALEIRERCYGYVIG